MANASRKKQYLKLTTCVEKLKILVRSVLTWMLFAFFDNLKIFVQLQHIRNIILSALEWQFFEILFSIPWQMKLKSWLIFQTNFSNFFYNKVYSFTFLGILRQKWLLFPNTVYEDSVFLESKVRFVTAVFAWRHFTTTDRRPSWFMTW